MNLSSRRFAVLAALWSAAVPVVRGDDPPPMPPQGQAFLTPDTAGGWTLEWHGVAGRTYFVQTSLDLVNWEYQPGGIAFGEGLWQCPNIRADYPRYYVRLLYKDVPSVTTLEEAENADFDDDGLSNIDEISVYGTDPLNADSDGDGLPDGWEVLHGLDPNDATGDNGAAGDPDHDGLTNLGEWQHRTNPLNPDTDGDGLNDSVDPDPLVPATATLRILTPLE